MKPASLIPCLLSLLALGLSASASPRERILFSDQWRFMKGDPADAADGLRYQNLKPWLLPTANALVTTAPAIRPAGEAPGTKLGFTQAAWDDSSWRVLNLPHDWGIEGPFDMALPGETAKLPWHGVAWYRKSFDLPESDQGRRILLEIEGAMSYSAVWCNGRLAGGWPYGYNSYHLDLTEYLVLGSRNTVAIRLDNPKDSSRWYPGGGIYRDVWLHKTSPVSVGPWGVFVSTPSVTAQKASVEIKAVVANHSDKNAEIQVATQVFKLSPTGQPEGAVLASSTPVRLALAAAAESAHVARLEIQNPRLWNLEKPELHTAVTLIQQNGKIVDRIETPFGIRSIEFTANDGFHLNGRRVPLRGVCLHHDLGALGAAFNGRAAARQLEMLREMGCNAIRLAHNPSAPGFLDLCDRMGFLAIAEFTDTWTHPKKPNGYAGLFNDWSEADLRALIRRDRNHPSVILWSTGNEVGEQGDLKRHPVSGRLGGIARDEDPTRLTTAGCDKPPAGHNGFQKTIDVFGYNYKPHEYGKFLKANPQQPLYGSETASCISSRGEYLFPVSDNKDGGKIGFQMSSYDLHAPGWASPPDTEFKGQDENPAVAGEFVWTGFDYLGEPTPFNNDLTVLTNFHTPEAKAKAEAELKALGKIGVPSRSSYFGIIDLAGFRKDRFYLYQSRWRPDLPMVHILPHWNWPERAGEVTPVHVYTSGDEAELFLNGRSLGRRKKGSLEYRLRWDDVKYEPGELKVVAYKAGRQWAEAVVETTGPPAKLIATPDRATIKADGRDLSFITIAVADEKGVPVPRSANPLKVEIEGPGEMVATDNGDPTDHTPFQSSSRSAFNGLGLVIVRGKAGETGAMRVRVTSEGLVPVTCTVAAAAE